MGAIVQSESPQGMPDAPRMGIMADDLTGALDTGVQFGGRGSDTVVALTTGEGRGADCLVLDTESRSVSPHAAWQRAGQTVRLLRGRLLYKKIDSTMRGNAGVELAAMMREVDVRKAVVAPAFPANGRLVHMGRLMVRGGWNDRVSGRGALLDSSIGLSIPQMLSRQMHEPVGLVDLGTVQQGADAIAATVRSMPERVCVVDTMVDADLSAVGEAIALSGNAWLPVGSAGLAGWLAVALGLPGVCAKPTCFAPTPGPLLMVVGSRSEVTRRQVRRAMATLSLATVEPYVERLVHRDNRVQQEEGLRVTDAVCRSLTDGRHTCINLSSSQSVMGGAHRIAKSVGHITSDIVKRSKVAGLLLTGGDTAYQVCRHMKLRALRPQYDIDSGLTASVVLGGEQEGLRIVTKAGGFGPEDAIVVGCRHFEG